MSSDGQGSVSPPRDADDNRGVKNKFSGNLKHELRTPLNNIIGYCEMLMEQDQAKELGHDSFASDFQKVHTAGRRLLDLIVENFSSIQVNSDAVGSDLIT